MKPLKVCMVTTFYPPYNFGGDGIFVQRLAMALARDGNEVHVVHDRDAFNYCSDGEPVTDGTDTGHPNITVHSLGAGNKADLLAVHQLGRPMGKQKKLKELLSDGMDVVHFHNVSLVGGPEILKYGSGVKLCTLHDHWFVCAMHVLWKYDREPCTQRSCLSCTLAGGRPPQIWRYTGAVADAAKHVQAFLAPSEFARESHLKNGFPAPIRVLPHFIPEEFLGAPDGAEWAQDQTGRSEAARPYFLFAGRLEKIKGVQFLIDVFRSYDKVDLLIAGKGTYEAELRAQAAGLNHVHFLSRVESQRLKRLYRHAIAALVPSLCYETFGLVALEAFAQGTPAIVHDLGALSEIIRDGGGMTYKTADELVAAMEKLRNAPSVRAQMASAALENLRSNYTEQRHLTQYYDMIAEFTDVLARRAKSTQEVR